MMDSVRLQDELSVLREQLPPDGASLKRGDSGDFTPLAIVKSEKPRRRFGHASRNRRRLASS